MNTKTEQTNEIKMLHEVIADYKLQNEKLKAKAEVIRVRNCDRMEELVKALSPWKKNYNDHKRIIESIYELKAENKELKAYKTFVKSKCENAVSDSDSDDDDGDRYVDISHLRP